MYAKLVFVVLSICAVSGMDNLRVAYQWKKLDFQYPNEEARRQAIAKKEFIPENALPLGLEVYENRLFVTVPRWKEGIPASLAYIHLNGKYIS